MDQHPLWLDAVEQVLERVHVRVSGKATSFEEAMTLVSEFLPDLVVAEIAGSDDSAAGTAWLLDLRQRFPEVKTIVLSTSNDPADIQAAFAAGAVAFVVKKAHPDDLAVAVRQAYEHSIYLPGFFVPSAGVHKEVPDQVDLTRREIEILRLVAEGHSNAELAGMLWVTEQTVKFHLSNIYRKLNVSNRTEASRWAQLHGLLQTAPSAAA